MLLLGIPVILLVLIGLGRRVRGLSRASQDRLADIGSVTSEVLGAMKIVQAFGQEKREADRFDHRAIDGADGAELMQAFKTLVENPLSMLA